MNAFTFYFQLGWEHIVSLDALDHQLFIAALISVYMIRDWKRILMLVTAFTLGHSLTLALSAFDLLRFRAEWVEFLIPVTIVITSLINLIRPDSNRSPYPFNYLLASGFGLVHGMGYANYIRFMLANDESLTTNLLAFNLGLEAAQIAWVVGLLAIGFLCVKQLGVRSTYWTFTLNAAAFSVALWTALLRLPFN